MQNIEEIWKDVPGYEGKYQASSLGRILSVRSGKILKPSINKGYEYVQLSRRKSLAVHRIIALVFIGESKLSVDHIDSNKRNNSITNLQYVSRGENTILSFKRKTAAVGSAKNQSILDEDDIIIIRDLRKKGLNLKTIASIFNSATSTISLIVNKKTWSHVR